MKGESSIPTNSRLYSTREVTDLFSSRLKTIGNLEIVSKFLTNRHFAYGIEEIKEDKKGRLFFCLNGEWIEFKKSSAPGLPI